MTDIIKSIRRFENRFDLYAERFVFHHPYLAFLTMFIGMPVFILFAVSICTVAITAPLMLLF